MEHERGRARLIAPGALVMLTAIALACGPSAAGGGGDGGGDGGGGGGAASCDTPPACSGTLNGLALTCGSEFANYSTGTGTTRFAFQASGAGIIGGFTMSFVGPPPSNPPQVVQLVTGAQGDSIGATEPVTLPDGGTGGALFGATAGGAGSIALTITSVKARDGGTPGDYCLDGTLTATLAGDPSGQPSSVPLSLSF
jgi:hypothetical protein